MCEENYDIYQCWDLKLSTAFCRKFNHVVNTQKYKVLKFEYRKQFLYLSGGRSGNVIGANDDRSSKMLSGFSLQDVKHCNISFTWTFGNCFMYFPLGFQQNVPKILITSKEEKYCSITSDILSAQDRKLRFDIQAKRRDAKINMRKVIIYYHNVSLWNCTGSNT